MNVTINYLLETNVGLILFMSIYWLFLKNENQFSTKRLYLILSIFLAFIFPLFHLNPISTTQNIPAIGTIIPGNWLPEVMVSANTSFTSQKASPSVGAWGVIGKLYFATFTLLFIILLYRITSIVRLFFYSNTYRWHNCYVAESEEEQPTFSFFNFIFIGQSKNLSNGEKEEILKHEQIHASQFHSLDILLINLVGIICWFNPFVHLYKKTLVQLHEFDADARSVANKDVDQYCGLLAKVALQSIHYPIANHFNSSLTIKRIEMMKTMKRNINPWKKAAITAFVPVFFYLVACQDQVKEISQNSSVALDVPKDVQEQVDKLKKENPKNTYSILETYEKGQNQIKELAKKGYHMDDLAGFELVNSGSRTFLIVAKNEGSIKFGEAVKSGDVYTFVEEMATPKMGMDAYWKYISDNLKYPKRAADANIQGKSFIKFIVNLDGSLSDFVVIKSLNDECDQEAIRVLKGSGEWNPGKQSGKPVRVAFIMPFNFQLDQARQPSKKPAEPRASNSVPEKMLVFYGPSKADKLFLEGSASVATDATALAGVKVTIKNTGENTSTDSEGKFSLKSSKEHGLLVFTLPGFESLEAEF
jgi:TonB family protein